MTATAKLKAPFPAFGGKSKVAAMVWERLGDVDNFIEPFCFSAAVLLGRKSEPKIETINDLNAYVSNFWRAVQSDPEAVAAHADWPVNETCLHAKHKWLVYSEQATDALQRVKDEPDYFDAKIAGWWCWGACCWIGSGWCDERHRNVGANQRPGLSECAGRGVNGLAVKLPHMDASRGEAITPREASIHQKRPRAPRENSGGSGWMPGVAGRPQLADAYARGRGVNGHDAASTCQQRRAWITDWMMRLADRLRPVRVCCGHWSRVCDSHSTLDRLGTTGVFLDPPYRKTVNGVANRHGELYANDKAQDVDALCDEVQAWCLKWGGNKSIRIALCGYEGEYPKLDGWEKVEWKASGGYGNQSGKVNENAGRERIWFSPFCVRPLKPKSLF